MSNYKEEVRRSIALVNSYRKVKDSGDMNLKVKKVAVILSGSRNGSSLLKTMVSKSKDLAYLAGEEEPYYIITENGFPYTSNSDGFQDVVNKQELLNNIFDELGINIDGKPSITQLKRDWYNRLTLQFPLLDQERLDRAEDLFSDILFKYYDESENNWNEVNQIFLREFFKYEQAYGYYDVVSENTPYIFKNENTIKIEEPPYVTPGWKKQITEEDLETKTLLFKTPQDCYRIGLFEKLFPNAEIKYVHLSRGFAQSVNGLMDGWLSETGFFAHNMDIVGKRLNIKGYTDRVKGGDRWWNFDLPDGWEYFANAPLEEVCSFQWQSAHRAILDSGVDALRIKFEDFLADGQATMNKITEYLGIQPITVKKLPVIMATSAPSSFRWHKREDVIMKLSESSRVKNLMEELGYEMNPETWI